MGAVILHAGIPKAGSSTIQDWLARNADVLRSRGTEVAVVRSRVPPGESREQLVLEPFDAGGVSSGAFVTVYLGFDRDLGVLDWLFEQLHAFADRYARVVLSCEGFAQLFAIGEGDAAFLDRLEELAGAHSVRVAYYVRPQHACLEAAWRQWGFRLSAPPSAYVTERAEQLHYLRTRAVVAAAAPHVSFEIRPFRTDLLYRGSPAADFAEHFLGAADLALDERDDHRVNVGLPLELVNAMRIGPPELLGRDTFDNRSLGRLQSVLRDFDVPESARIHRSRLVLQAYCHERFGEENRMLVETERWPAGEFVPAAGLTEWDLTELDDLWRPEASAGELALLYRALVAAIS
jgi:hypothetical protein